MTFDPTTNRIQTVHLTPEERAALEAWPHGWEYYDEEWHNINPSWASFRVYRGKPAPVVTSIWFNVYKNSMSIPYGSRAYADLHAFKDRIDVLRIETCNGVSTAHLEGLKDER
jgi:hypothetical protein